MLIMDDAIMSMALQEILMDRKLICPLLYSPYLNVLSQLVPPLSVSTILVY